MFRLMRKSEHERIMMENNKRRDEYTYRMMEKQEIRHRHEIEVLENRCKDMAKKIIMKEIGL